MERQQYEVVAGFTLWIGAVLYSISRVIRVRKDFDNFDDVYGDFKPGWLVEGVKKDAADYEWETTLVILLEFYLWLVVHLVVSEYLRQTFFKAIPYWQITVALLFVISRIGVTGAVIISAQPLVFECFGKLKRPIWIWICSGICLACICYVKLMTITDGHVSMLGVNETQHYMIVVAICWINLRCIGYYLDNTSSSERSLLQVFAFCFYLPTLFLGPFIQFANFKESQKCHSAGLLGVRITKLLCSIIRFGFWLISTEFALHYVYVNALSFQPQMVKSLDSWSLFGYGYCMGQFFHLKYVVIYGLSTSLSKFEHIPAPSLPKCIGRIHLYSDMWKYFDEGLYKFLLRYIYLPSLSSNTVGNKLFSSLLCFSFIFIWHGLYRHIFVWAMLNFFGICIENLFQNLFKCTESKCSFLNRNWKHRLLCFIVSPLLVMSAVSNFYFFAGIDVGNIFVERIIYGPWSSNACLLFFLSCCSLVSMEIKKWERC